MTRFNRTEARSMVLATGLLLLGVAARLGLGPAAADVGWTTGSTARGGDAELGAARLRVEEEVAAEERASRPLAPGEMIDPNTASVTELRRLPGIGPSKASAIADDRERNGPFRDLADLSRVPGIGPSTVSRLSAHLSLRRPRAASRRSTPAAPPEPRSPLVDVNRAQINELEQITGIGPTLAMRIAETRRRIGRFRGPEDLLLVPGIGPGVLHRIRGQVRF